MTTLASNLTITVDVAGCQHRVLAPLGCAAHAYEHTVGYVCIASDAPSDNDFGCGEQFFLPTHLWCDERRRG